MVASAFQSGMKDLDPGQLLRRALPHLPIVAVWIAAIAIGIQAALLVRHFIPQRSSAAVPAAGTSFPPSRRVQPVDFQGILAAHLFGIATPEGATGDPASAPQTQLALVLTGVVADTDPQKGFGIIGESAANTKVYAVGAQVPGGVKLHAVYPDRVVLDRSGQLETLVLPRQSLGTPPPPMTRAALPGADNPAVDRMRQLIANEPGVISEIMRPQPVFANGQQRGYRVYPGRNRQAFVRLGLRPGDLVTAINGTPLDDPARGQEIFGTLSSASAAQVTVMRNGRQQTLTLNMAQLAAQAQELQNGNPGGEPQPMEQAEPVPPPPNPAEGTP